VLAAAASVIERDGLAGLSLRSVAGDLGVSHTAFRHHFGSREGVLNALAVQGHELLADALRAARDETGSFLEMGVAYVRFAVAHPAHFAVMFRPDLLDESDPELAGARHDTFSILRGGIDELQQRGAVEDAAAATIAGWAIVHGIAGLVDGGTLRITARRVADRVEIAVENPRDPNCRRIHGQGVGLSTLRERLAARFGSEARLEVR